MPRQLRIYLLACIGLAFGYLVLHIGEPLRLSVGDPWTDASVVSAIANLEPVATRDPSSVPVIVYGALSSLLGTHEIAVFRVFALVFSALAAWLLFHWVRRVWNDTVAIVATALTTTSLLWLLYADSIYRAPIVHAACFLALWGTARALETGLVRHYLAVALGTFACLIAAPNDWIFLPAGVLFTIHIKSGSPLARGNWRVLAACALAAVLAALLRSPFSDPSTWQSVFDQRASATYVTLVRRYAALLTPMVWLTLAWSVWRALRAPSIKAAVEDGTTWMLVAAIVFAYLPSPRPESAMLRTQLLLPLYAIGSGLLIARSLEGGRWRRSLAIGWCTLAPVWGLCLIALHPRELLAREDVARANEYLARTDGNSFVISNLLADAPLVAAFGRHGWAPQREVDPAAPYTRILELFEAIGTDTIHAVIFTTPGSRFVDRSIAQVIRRRMPSVDGWPLLVPSKVDAAIAAYDAQVMRKLEVAGGTRVLQLANFDIYRFDRGATLAAAARAIPVAQRIDFARVGAAKFQLAGWGTTVASPEATALRSSIAGFERCRSPLAARPAPAPSGCTVVATPRGLHILDVGGVRRAELAIRIERACDQQLTIELDQPAHIAVAFNGATLSACSDLPGDETSVTIRISQHHVRAGLNIISFEDTTDEHTHHGAIKHRPEVRSVVLEPRCEPSLPSKRQID